MVYGRPGWLKWYGTAEWSDKVGGLSTGRLLPPYGQARVDLAIIPPSPKIGDFVWTWYNDCIVTDSTLALFREAGFTGFEARPVTVEKFKRMGRKRSAAIAIPPLWELLIQGKGGDAAPESGIYVMGQDEESGSLEYSSFRNGILVDEANWDGTDFFTVNGYPKYILVTERVKELIIGHQLTNCALIPSDKLEWSGDLRPEEHRERAREMAARELESLLADLDESDKPSDTIYALGLKGDPRAVDPIIRRFDDRNPFVWHSAAGSAAEIASNKSLPESVREQIFSKLKGLLTHDDPWVRKSAATAIGYVRGQPTGEVLMGLFEDPDEGVRRTAVFMIHVLRYKPALDAVKRLTRDRSKDVREAARRAERDLTAECP